MYVQAATNSSCQFLLQSRSNGVIKLESSEESCVSGTCDETLPAYATEDNSKTNRRGDTMVGQFAHGVMYSLFVLIFLMSLLEAAFRLLTSLKRLKATSGGAEKVDAALSVTLFGVPMPLKGVTAVRTMVHELLLDKIVYVCESILPPSVLGAVDLLKTGVPSSTSSNPTGAIKPSVSGLSSDAPQLIRNISEPIVVSTAGNERPAVPRRAVSNVEIIRKNKKTTSSSCHFCSKKAVPLIRSLHKCKGCVKRFCAEDSGFIDHPPFYPCKAPSTCICKDCMLFED